MNLVLEVKILVKLLLKIKKNYLKNIKLDTEK